MALNLANVQTSDTFQTWFTRTNQIIGSAFPTTGGTITGSLTVDGDALFSGNTTIVNKTIIATSDALIQLAANNEFSDILDIGFFGHYSTGSGNNHTGLIRDSGTKEYYLFGQYLPGAEPTSDININHATFELANSHVYKLYANSLSVEGPASISGYVQLTGTGQLKLPVGNTVQRISDTVGALRYNNEINQFEGYSSAGWGQIGGGGLGKFEFVANTYTAESGNRIAADTSTTAFTVTLPGSPSADDIVEFIDQENTFHQNNLTIARNGSTIQGLSQDLIADISSTNFYMQYDGSTWKVFGIASGTQYYPGTLSVNALDVTTNINANTATFTGEVNAQDFNTTSDISMKNSVATISNASQIIENLRGVSFKWNSTDKPAYGVVAQEVEKVLPDLVVDNEDGVKSVKYLGLIGFLIESNKQLIQRMETLEQKLRDN